MKHILTLLLVMCLSGIVTGQQAVFNLENGNPRDHYLGSTVTNGTYNDLNTPGCKLKAAIWECGGSLYVLGGGYSPNGYTIQNTSDFWKYSPQLNSWKWIQGTTTGQATIYGSKGIFAVANYPGARIEPLTWTINGKLYLYSGNGTSELWVYDTLVSQWAWLKGANTVAGSTTHFGVMGISDTANTPGSRSGSTSWVYNNKLYLQGGYSPAGLMNDVWVYNPATNDWTWLKGSVTASTVAVPGTQGVADAANRPFSMFGAKALVIGDKVYVFGGSQYLNGSQTNILWLYDMVTNNWTWLKGSPYFATASYGVKNVAAPANNPTNRFSMTGFVYNNKLYFFGGINDNNGSPPTFFYNDMWTYDPATNNWTWIKGDATVNRNGKYPDNGVVMPDSILNPGGRGYTNGILIGDKFFLFGGNGYAIAGDNTYLNDVWTYSLTSGNWNFLKGFANPDETRYYPATGVYSKYATPGALGNGVTWACNGKMYLYGSMGGDTRFASDVWDYDPQLHQWRLLKSRETVINYNIPGIYGTINIAAPTNHPGIRQDAVGWTYNNKLYLFGGYGVDAVGGFGFLNDMWAYDVFTNNWTWLKGDTVINGAQVTGASGTYAANLKPGSRGSSVGFTNNGKFYLFGGEIQGSSANDLWAYDPAVNNWSWIKGAYSLQYTNYGTPGVGAAGNVPGSRLGALGWAQNNKLYLLGGSGYSGQNQFQNHGLLNDLWEYDLGTGFWKWLKGGTNATFVTSTGLPSVYGTMGVAAPGNAPGSIYQNKSCWTVNNKLRFLGGYGYYNSYYNPDGLNTQWEYDPATNNWTWISGAQTYHQTGYLPADLGPSTQNMISSRYNAKFWKLNGTMFFYGGYGPNTSSLSYIERSDMWRLENTCSYNGLAVTGSIDVHDANSATVYTNQQCGIIATVLPLGNNPVFGNVSAKVTSTANAGYFGNLQYVRRHFDILPVNNDSTATAGITLYFTQQDFDNFNASATGSLLPSSPVDVTGVANMRVSLIKGNNATNNTVVANRFINPDDNSIIWNAVASRWEVSFNANGMGGFYVFADTIASLSLDSVCAGTILQIPFIADTLAVGNVFTAQLSDAAGSFASPITIGVLNSNISGSVTSTIPVGATGGAGYRVRVIAGGSVVTHSQDIGYGFTIKPQVIPTVSITASPSAAVFTGTVVTFTAVGTGGGPNPVYNWQKNNVNIPGAQSLTYMDSSLANGDIISIKLTSSANCANPDSVIATPIGIYVFPASISNIALGQQQFVITPNPNAGSFSVPNIDWGPDCKIEIANSFGAICFSKTVQGSGWDNKIQLGTNFSNGFYILIIHTKEGKVFRSGFVLAKN